MSLAVACEAGLRSTWVLVFSLLRLGALPQRPRDITKILQLGEAWLEVTVVPV